VYYKNKSNLPSYKFSDFKKACKNPKEVIIFSDAYYFADLYFSLRTKKQILSFIQSDGLENLSFLNTRRWGKNPNKNNPIMVDSYEFISGYRKGYLAFMYNKITGKWIIKSFHTSKHMEHQ